MTLLASLNDGIIQPHWGTVTGPARCKSRKLNSLEKTKEFVPKDYKKPGELIYFGVAKCFESGEGWDLLD